MEKKKFSLSSFNVIYLIFFVKIESNYEKKEENYLNFLANINTSSNYLKPFYAEVSLVKDELKKLYVFAIKTSNSIAILDGKNKKFSIKYQIYFEDPLISKQMISTFILFYEEKLQKILILIGFKSGLILLYDIDEKKIVNKFNSNDNYQSFKKVSIQKIILIKKIQFLVLFYDSTLLFFDGFLSIYDLVAHEALILFKSSIAGINSINFSESGKLLAMGCQDDCITIINFNEKKELRIKGHKSFVSRVIISEKFIREKEILRIFASSYDSFFSITDIEYDKMENIKINNEILPIRVDSQADFEVEINNKNKFKISPEGIGNFIKYENYLLTSGFDGIVVIWKLESKNINSEEIKKKSFNNYN